MGHQSTYNFLHSFLLLWQHILKEKKTEVENGHIWLSILGYSPLFWGVQGRNGKWIVAVHQQSRAERKKCTHPHLIINLCSFTLCQGNGTYHPWSTWSFHIYELIKKNLPHPYLQANPNIDNPLLSLSTLFITGCAKLTS